MKRYVIFAAAILLMAGCTSYKQSRESRSAATAVRYEAIERAVNSDRFVINISRLNTRRGVPIDLRPENNYVAVSNSRARLNLAYVGRSYDLRGIAGINLTGDIVEKSMKYRKNGSMQLNLRVRQNNDLFRVNITVGKDGYCTVSVSHPRIDYISYRGVISPLQTASR